MGIVEIFLHYNILFHSNTPTKTHPLQHTHYNSPTPTHPLYHTHSNTLSPTHPLTHTHYITLTPTHSLHHTHSTTPTPTHTLQHTHSTTLTPTHFNHHSSQTHFITHLYPNHIHLYQPLSQQTPHFNCYHSKPYVISISLSHPYYYFIITFPSLITITPLNTLSKFPTLLITHNPTPYSTS